MTEAKPKIIAVLAYMITGSLAGSAMAWKALEGNLSFTCETLTIPLVGLLPPLVAVPKHKKLEIALFFACFLISVFISRIITLVNSKLQLPIVLEGLFIALLLFNKIVSRNEDVVNKKTY